MTPSHQAPVQESIERTEEGDPLRGMKLRLFLLLGFKNELTEQKELLMQWEVL